MKLPPAPRAVVTGAASGLGRAFAVELARRGGRVLIADVDLEASRETAQRVERAGGQAEVLNTDVTRVEELERAAELAAERWGGTDLLVNNAGVAVAGAIGQVPLADWEWVLRVNLWGVIHGCHVFAPRMKTQGGGFILNVASSAGFAALPEMAPYNVTKAAVIALSETLNAELSPAGVRVGVLCPTFFASNLLRSFRTPSEAQRATAEAWFERAGATAEQVARSGLEGLERGRVLTIPQLDGRVLRWVKRLAPESYGRALRWHQARARG